MDQKQKLIIFIKEKGNFLSKGQKEKILHELNAFSEEEQGRLIALFEKHTSARQAIERIKGEWKVMIAEFSQGSLPAARMIGRALKGLSK